MHALFTLTLALAAAPLAIGGGEQSPAPFPLELALGIRRPSTMDRLALSPDGKHVAYTIGEAPAPESAAPALFRGLRLHVVDTTNGKIDWHSAGSGSAWAASWSPDGRTVAFYSDEGREVGLWSFRVGDRAAKRLGSFVVGAFHHMRPEWTSDGASILVPTIVPAAQEKPEHAAQAPASPAATASVVVRLTGGESLATPDPIPAPKQPDAPPPGAVQSLVAAPPAALSAVNAQDGSLTQILPAGERPQFMAAKVSPSGTFVACEQSLRAIFDGGLTVLLDLALVRRSDGTTLHRAEGIAIDVNIDPTSPTLAAMAWHPTQDRFAYLHGGKLVLVDLTGEKASTRELPLGEHAARAERLRFTPDGSTLLVSVLAAESSAEDPFLERVLAIPTGEGTRRELTPPEGIKLRGVISANWRSAWQPEAGAIVAAGTELKSGEAVFVRIPLDATPATVVHRVDGSLRIVAALERGRAVALLENGATAPDYFLVGADFAPLQRLSRAEPLLEGVQVGPLESFATEIVTNGEQRTARAVIALPPGGKKGEKFPTIVTQYPGMELSRQARGFGGGSVASIPAAVFTTRGYAVLVLDVPLAPFGVPSNPLRDIQSAVLPQIARAVELGYTDADRVGVIGHSYGGYGAACLVCGTSALRAAVAVSGSYDLAGIYAAQRPDELETSGPTMNTVLMEKHQGRMGKPLWDEPQRYLDNSPYYQADKIHTPLLLLHGRVDPNCLVGEAEKLFNALKRLGGTAQLAIYEGEGHVPDEWSRASRLDLATRTLAFFERQLKAAKSAGR
ncbi:MAG: S9 family peptidase [Planctomycetes bacterium]|nr:S9 family peptidase [Planctomycetota bacterium]